MKIFRSVPFVDFSLGKDFTKEEVTLSRLAARDDIDRQLYAAGVDVKRVAWSEERDPSVKQKRFVVKVMETQQERFEVFSDQYQHSH